MGKFTSAPAGPSGLLILNHESYFDTSGSILTGRFGPLQYNRNVIYILSSPCHAQVMLQFGLEFCMTLRFRMVFGIYKVYFAAADVAPKLLCHSCCDDGMNDIKPLQQAIY